MELRGLYITIALVDKLTPNLRRIDSAITQTKSKIATLGTSLIYMSASFDKCLATAAYFFEQVDKAEKEAIIRARYHSKVIQEIALKYETLKSKVISYASTVKTSLASATAFIREHTLALVGVGVGASYFLKKAVDSGAQWELMLEGIKRVAKETGRDYKSIMKILQEETDALTDRVALAQAVLKLMTTSLTDEQIRQFIRAAKEGTTVLGYDFNEQIVLLAKGFKQLEANILDNMAVNIRLEQIYEKASKQFGVTREQLTEAQIQQVLFNEILKQTAKYQGMWEAKLKSSSGALAEFRTAIRDLTLAIGETLLPIITPLIRGLTHLIRTINEIPFAKTTIAVGVLSLAFLGLVGTVATHIVPAIREGATILARLFIPSAVRSAYATGGLTMALRTMALTARTASISLLGLQIPLLPLIATIGAVVGAVLLLQHAWVHNWFDIRDKTQAAINAIRGAIDWLIGGIKTLIGWITAIPTKISEAWNFIARNPIGKVAEFAFGLTPIGVGINLAKTIHHVIKPEISTDLTKVIPTPSQLVSSTVIHQPTTTYQIKHEHKTIHLTVPKIEINVKNGDKETIKRAVREVIERDLASHGC